MIELNGEIAQQQLEDEINFAYQDLDEEDYLLADDQEKSERIFSKLITTNNNMNSNKICWTTKDGRTIPVDDLTESHAKNILKMLIRNQNKNKSSTTHYRSTENKWDLEQVEDSKPNDYYERYGNYAADNYDEYIENDMAADYVDGR